jgi:hypothetical protein
MVSLQKPVRVLHKEMPVMALREGIHGLKGVAGQVLPQLLQPPA